MPTNANTVTVQAAHGPSTPPLASLERIDLVNDTSEVPAWWIVEADAREAWFDTSGGGVDCPSASAIGLFERRSGLLASLAWRNEFSGRQLFFDLGPGLRLCVWASSIELSVCGPADLQRAYPGRPLILGDQVSVTRVDGSASKVERCNEGGLVLPGGSLGFRQGTLSLRQFVPAGGPAPTVLLPPGATGLQIYESPRGGGGFTNTPWSWVDRTGDDVGSVPLASGSSSRVAVPGFALAVRLAAAPVVDTVYSLAWELDW